MKFEKGSGHDWIIDYKFEEESPDSMSVFGCMTAEAALKEARFSLDGWNNINAGQYEIFAVKRSDKEGD